MSKNSTGYTSTTKNPTAMTGNSAFTGGVTLGDLTVRLSSLTVTLLGRVAGGHFFDNKNPTLATSTTKNPTAYITP